MSKTPRIPSHQYHERVANTGSSSPGKMKNNISRVAGGVSVEKKNMVSKRDAKS